MKHLLLLIIGLLGGVSVAGAVDAQTDDSAEKPLLPEVEMLVAKVRVSDPDDNPVEGAIVSVGGMRTKAEPGSHWSWRPKEFGEHPKKETDADGMVEMPYPKYVTEKLETGQMTWLVKHPDFINFNKDFSVDADPAEIKMKRGFKIAASAVDGETGERLTKDLYAVAGGYGNSWKLKTNGMLVSSTMPKKQRLLRVVELVEGRPARFSERVAIKPGDKSRVLLKDIALSRGTRVVGKLDESVTRPVKNGYVVAQMSRKPTDDSSWDTRWTWGEKVKIEEDGTFVFESLPSDEVLQMIPVCDGWSPKAPKANEIAPFFPDDTGNVAGWAAVPSLIKVEGEEVAATLKMVKAKGIRVVVVGPDGQPVVGADIYSCPNQKWFDGGSQIYGQGFSTRESLVESRKGDFQFKPIFRYSAVTDENGVAEMANLPDAGRSRSLNIVHDDFELAIVGRSREFNFEFDEADVTELTVKMQKKGTEVMDGSQVREQQNARNNAENIGRWLKRLFE